MLPSSPLNSSFISIEQRIATEITVQVSQVISAVKLLDEGATVPFIARYRKEATGGLDDTQLRKLVERLSYLRELEDRRSTIFKSIEEQGKLTANLRSDILQADTKQRLEDLYLPYKPKRRTKAQIAKEAGLEPLADALIGQPTLAPEELAKAYINEKNGIADTTAALDGARAILMERFAEDAGLILRLREYMKEKGFVYSKVIEGKQTEGQKFADYFEYSEALKLTPSHRALALFRGRSEGILSIAIKLPENEQNPSTNIFHSMIIEHYKLDTKKSKWLADTVRWTWDIKLGLSVEIDLFTELRERSEKEAINVFARNVKDLLLAAPAGFKTTIGLDPGIRTGVKVAVVDGTGKLLETATIYPHAPKNDWEGSLAVLAALVSKHKAEIIAIGNGTASRETDKLVVDLTKRFQDVKLSKVIVSEAGASVYSASELAALEFPNLDVSLRGAVSIARRLQDPLAELVKIDPKAIGVGQYQHDVNQSQLAKSLDAVVEDCVNAVGVDLNTASAALLTRVSGLNASLAENIVSHRNTHGVFKSRAALKQVPRLGEKTFEQAAGFLRISNGENPLDASAVHPESYPIVEKILKELSKPIKEIIGNNTTLSSLKPENFVDEHFGLPTIKDIIKELEKPGRDPRPEFKTATLNDKITGIEHLEIGMMLEGTITNVTNFGAFVDIGVHQDGLVHISALSNTYVSDPHQVVKAGDIVKVRVVEIDAARNRIGLTMKLQEAAPHQQRQDRRDSTAPQRNSHDRSSQERRPHDNHQRNNQRQQNFKREEAKPMNTLANAFASAFQKVGKN